ncbi:MAG: chemotaxis protein CheW [Burkholderiales bacterium]|nr:chemotaxis protein CheW [Burkholderiales bacterium]
MGEQAQYLTFALGDEVFALDIRVVREIIQYASVTVVPLMPAFVRGVMNLRGAVVPVIDLQVRLGRSRSQVGKKTCVVIFDATLEGERVELGLMVDAVNEVVDIAESRIEPAPQFGTSVARQFISGLGRVGDLLVTILAPEQALDIEAMALLAGDHEGTA